MREPLFSVSAIGSISEVAGTAICEGSLFDEAAVDAAASPDEKAALAASKTIAKSASVPARLTQARMRALDQN